MSYSLPIPLNFKVTYILELEDSCWYVGIAKNGQLNKRLAHHLSSGASGWTMVHKVVRVYRVLVGDREEEITRSMIDKYGPNKVRGWNYVQVHEPTFDAFTSPIHGCITLPDDSSDVVSLFANVQNTS
jgi:predicted GIY-YIG superfamily endonuclease